MKKNKKTNDKKHIGNSLDMKKKILVGVTAFLILALVGFGLNSFTGEVVKNLKPDVTVFPSSIKAGENVNIKVRPRGGCVDPEIGFYFSGLLDDGRIVSSGGRKGVVRQKGGFKICKNDGLILDDDGTFTVSYRTHPEWRGQYLGKVFYWKDRKTKEVVNAYFDVMPNEN